MSLKATQKFRRTPKGVLTNLYSKMRERAKNKNIDEDEAKYPPFTAEKQLELIKWLAKRENLGCEEKIAISISEDDYCFVSMGLRILEAEQETYSDYCFGSKTFERALAGLINTLWQDLTEEERKQVKGILE